MRRSNSNEMKRDPSALGFLDCIPVFGTSNSTKKGNDVDEFKKQDDSFEGKVMMYTQMVGGLFAIICLGIALISDGENQYDRAVLCLQMFGIAVFFVYFAFLNSTLLYNNNQKEVQVRMLVAFILAGGFGGYCCVQANWYSLATQNPVMVNSVVHTDLSAFGTQRLTFMLTPVYDDGTLPEVMNTYPVLSLSGMGKNETRLHLTRPDGSSRLRALVGTTDFTSENCDKFGDDNKFDMYEYVNCLPLYEEVVSCTRVYTYEGTLNVPRNESISGFDSSLMTDTKKLLASIWSTTTGQVKLTVKNSTFTPYFGQTEYSFTITACAAMSAQAGLSCNDFSSQCSTVCQNSDDFESSATCFAHCREISNFVCTKHKVKGMVEMLVLDSAKASDQSFKATMGTVFQDSFDLRDGNVDVVVSQDNTHARFEISTYDSTGKSLAESSCSLAAVSGHASLAGIVSINAIQCSLYNLQGTAEITASGNWAADSEDVKSKVTNFYSATSGIRKMIEVSQVLDSSGAQDATKVDYTAYVTSQTEHSEAMVRCNNFANKVQAPVTALTCVDGENNLATRRQLLSSTLNPNIPTGYDFGCDDEYHSFENQDMCMELLQMGNLYETCQAILNQGFCVTGAREAYYCCPGTCGHCKWAADGPKTDEPWNAETIATSAATACSTGNPIKFSMNVGAYPQEVSWTIQDRNGVAVSPTCEGDNPYQVQSNTQHDKTCCLAAGEYRAVCDDSASDGWDSGSLSIESFSDQGDAWETLCAFTNGGQQTTDFDVSSSGQTIVHNAPILNTSQPPATSATGSTQDTSTPDDSVYVGDKQYMYMEYATCESRGWFTVVIEEECNALGRAFAEMLTGTFDEEARKHGTTFGGSFQPKLSVRSSTAYAKGCVLDHEAFSATFEEIERQMMDGHDEWDTASPSATGNACIHVNRPNALPGYYTCACVDPNDSCLKSGSCVTEPECPHMHHQSTGVMCHNYCPLSDEVCNSLGYEFGSVDEMVQCDGVVPCFEIEASGGILGGFTILKGCLNPPDSCESYTTFGASLGGTVHSCTLSDGGHTSAGTGRRQLNTQSPFEGQIFDIPLILNTADSSTMCTEEHMCLCRMSAETDFTTEAPTDDQQVDEVVQSNDAAKAALALVEGNAGRSQIYELTLDFQDDTELIECGKRSCRVVNVYFIMSKLGYKYVNFNFWTGSDTENAVSLIQSDRFLRAGYKLEFDEEKFLDQSSTKRVQLEMIQYGEQPDENAKKWVKVQFLLPAKNRKVPAYLAEEKLTYTIGDVWTAIIATSGLAGAMFAFVFPNVLSKSYFRFAPWKPHVDKKVPLFTSNGEFDETVFQGGELDSTYLEKFQQSLRKLSTMNYQEGINTGSPALAELEAPSCESPRTHVEVELSSVWDKTE